MKAGQMVDDLFVDGAVMRRGLTDANAELSRFRAAIRHIMEATPPGGVALVMHRGSVRIRKVTRA